MLINSIAGIVMAPITYLIVGLVYDKESEPTVGNLPCDICSVNRRFMCYEHLLFGLVVDSNTGGCLYWSYYRDPDHRRKDRR